MYTYSQHELLYPPRLIGVRLSAFCLGHVDVLCGLDNTFFLGVPPAPRDLAVALFVCSRSQETARREIRTGKSKKAMRRLTRRCRRMKPGFFDAVSDSFFEYLAIYSSAPPRWQTAGGKAVERAPGHLCVFATLQEKTNYTPDECWDMPLPRALEILAAICANAGDESLVTSDEMGVFDALNATAADEPAPPSNTEQPTTEDQA